MTRSFVPRSLSGPYFPTHTGILVRWCMVCLCVHSRQSQRSSLSSEAKLIHSYFRYLIWLLFRYYNNEMHTTWPRPLTVFMCLFLSKLLFT